MSLAPIHSKTNGEHKFKLDDVLNRFKDFYIHDCIYLAGSVVFDGEGNDIDIIIREDGLSEYMKEAISFRLYRQFAALYDIPYDEVPNYLHISYSSGPYTDNIQLYRLKLERVENPEIVKMNIKVIEKADRRIIIGYASVIEVDSQNQIITKEALEDAMNRFMQSKERILTIEHEAIPVGYVLDKYDNYETHVDERGLFIVGEIRKDLEIANEVWNKILNEELTGLSIHGEVIKSYVKDGVDIVEKMNMYEIAICENPVNKKARLEVL